MKSLFKSLFFILVIFVVIVVASCKVSLNVINAASYTVTFETNGGSTISSQTVTEDHKAIKPDNPSKPDTEDDRFVFDNWYTSTDEGLTLSDEPFNFDTPIKNNITLYAKWNRTDITYTVTYSTDWGNVPSTIPVVKNTVLTAEDLPELSEDGFVFLGWYDNSTKVLAGDYMVTNDVVLSARWDYSEPLTLEFLAAGTITITGRWSTLKYSRNGGKLTLATDSITVKKGDKICFYAEAISSSMNINCSSDCYIYGNIMSLVTLYSDSIGCNTKITSVTEYAFMNLFSNNTKIKSHSTKLLYLPATELADYCYYGMFSFCSNLTKAPVISATQLAEFCCAWMFMDCNSLKQAPSLPATTLANYCYASMFYGCNSLEQAPSLPATTLASHCYQQMFLDCTSLVQASDLPATILADFCYSHMFEYCSNMNKAPDLPAITLADNCYSSMFSGCKNLTKAPDLPAAILVSNCYSGMFTNCSRLESIKCLATDISANNCTKNWVEDVFYTGTFITATGMEVWSRDENGIPSKWTVQEE